MPPENDISVRDRKALSLVTRQLQARVKELDCVFGISEIVERSGGSVERILAETVEILPVSWEHPEVACARIRLGDREYSSDGYGEGSSVQRAVIVVHGEDAVEIEVRYLEPRPVRDEGPFTESERRLLNAVAERLGHVVERLTAERKLREQEEELRTRITHLTRVNTVGEMASSIAHEVNQPLTAIATYAQACRRLVRARAFDDADVGDVLDRIGEEALRAGDIIRRLRELVRKTKREVVPCDLNELVGNLKPLASVDARLNDVRLRLALDPELPPVLGDGVELQQVALNLIRNGIDAMTDTAPGQRILEVRTSSVAGEEALVTVTDHGCGLAEELEDELFEPFFTTKESGMGLGLFISRSIVTAHDGRIWYTRNADGGTTFSFTVPQAPKEDHA